MTRIALCLFALHLPVTILGTNLTAMPAPAFAAAAPKQEASPAATAHGLPAPDGLAPAVGARLGKGGVRVTLGKTVLTFWWVQALPAEAGSGGWAGVEEGTLVGALSVEGDFRDIRARLFKPGVYTLRYGVQPENGDHLGVSPFREFLLASPSALDSDPAPRGHDGTIEISKEAVGGSHPAVLSIDPPAAKQDVLQIHKTQLDHQAIIMEVPVTRDGKPSGTLRFGVVVVGRIEA